MFSSTFCKLKCPIKESDQEVRKTLIGAKKTSIEVILGGKKCHYLNFSINEPTIYENTPYFQNPVSDPALCCKSLGLII